MCGYTMTEWESRRITQAWAIIKPNGDICLDSTFENEKSAWEIVLGYPNDDEIKTANESGYKSVFATVVV